MQSIIIHSLTLSIAAFVWVIILTKPQNIFDFVPPLFNKYFGQNHPKWERMLYGCAKCVGGQLAFWSGFFILPYDPINHLTTIILTIFIAYILEKYV